MKTMFRCITLMILSFIASGSFASKFFFGPDKLMIDGRTNASAVKPGDTIYLNASTRQYLLLRSLHGTQALPILVQNYGGQVILENGNYGIKFDTCSWIKCAGSGTPGHYGILIRSVNAGIAIQGLSTCIEVSGVEVDGASWTGLVAKTDPDCSFKSTRGKYTMRNISIHDNYFHMIADEGMYIGHSYYSGYTLHCNGKDTVVYPHLIRGLNVYNNIVENTGWDGIQVSSADSACAVFANQVYLDSQGEVAGQMSGFLLGGGSSCNCYSNTVKDGKGDGIDELGQGGNFIYNNLIIRAGKSLAGSSPKHGIYVGTQSPAAGRGYHIVYNTIISPKTNGIDFRSTSAVNSEASDNIITDPGGSYIKPASGTSLTQEKNVTAPSADDVKFVNAAALNFDLQASSPAVNNGSVITGLQLGQDNLGRSRPWAVKYDIGAFECHDSSLLSVGENRDPLNSMVKSCFYRNGMLNVQLALQKKDVVDIALFTADGKQAAQIYRGLEGPGIISVEKPVGGLANACYLCVIRLAGDRITRKIIISADQ
jgi:hypothetical protein